MKSNKADELGRDMKYWVPLRAENLRLGLNYIRIEVSSSGCEVYDWRMSCRLAWNVGSNAKLERTKIRRTRSVIQVIALP